MSPRQRNLIAAIAAILLLAVLVTVVLLAITADRQRSKPDASLGSSPELRIYGGLPHTVGYPHPIVVLTNIGYLVGYCEERRNPAWVSFSISNITIAQTLKRPATFLTDTRTRSQVTHHDYTNSGYDRGHMAPNYAIATRYGHEAQRETFLLSNISPQSPNLNRFWWRKLEELEANDLAVRLERVWVLTGPVFKVSGEKLRSGVEIPTSFYRIILDEENGVPRVLAFVAPQTLTGREPLTDYLATVREIEGQTGLDFFPSLPREVQDRMETVRAQGMW